MPAHRSRHLPALVITIAAVMLGWCQVATAQTEPVGPATGATEPSSQRIGPSSVAAEPVKPHGPVTRPHQTHPPSGPPPETSQSDNREDAEKGSERSETQDTKELLPPETAPATGSPRR